MSKLMYLCTNCFVVVLTSDIALAQPYNLVIEVKPHKSVILTGEPLLVRVMILNRSTADVKLIHHNAPTLNEAELSVVDLLLGIEPERVTRWSDGFRLITKTNPRILESNENVVIDLVILFGRQKGFSVVTPGKYWIAARVVIAINPYIEIISQPVEIEVREPHPEDRAVWEWLKENQEHYGRLVQIPWAAELPQDFVAECQRLCETSDSAYAEYLALFLSRWYWEGPEKDRVEAAKYARIAEERASSETMKELAAKALSATE